MRCIVARGRPCLPNTETSNPPTDRNTHSHLWCSPADWGGAGGGGTNCTHSKGLWRDSDKLLMSGYSVATWISQSSKWKTVAQWGRALMDDSPWRKPSHVLSLKSSLIKLQLQNTSNCKGKPDLKSPWQHEIITKWWCHVGMRVRRFEAVISWCAKTPLTAQ